MIDLHMHSIYSDDGQFSPAALMRLCAEADVEIASVTDHNCARANEEAAREARALGILYLPGIEIDCSFAGVDLHLLGYGIHPDGAALARIEEEHSRQFARASRLRLARTRELGFCVTEAEMEAIALANGQRADNWTSEMFAEVLLARPEYADHPLLLPYRPGGARGENPLVNFHWDFYAQGKPCHAPMECPSLEEAVAAIRSSGGLAVLAHPGINLKGRERLLGGIIARGVDGIEAFCSYHTPEQATLFLHRARAYGLLVTCGSDFHGKTKPAVSLGGHGCTLAPAEVLNPLRQALLRAALRP